MRGDTNTHSHTHMGTRAPLLQGHTSMRAVPWCLLAHSRRQWPCDLHWLCKVRLERHLTACVRATPTGRPSTGTWWPTPHLCRPCIPVLPRSLSPSRRQALRVCTSAGPKMLAPVARSWVEILQHRLSTDRRQSPGCRAGHWEWGQGELAAGRCSVLTVCQGSIPLYALQPCTLLVLFGPGLGNMESVPCLGPTRRKCKKLRVRTAGTWAPALEAWSHGLPRTRAWKLACEFLRAGSAALRGTHEGHSG